MTLALLCVVLAFLLSIPLESAGARERTAPAARALPARALFFVVLDLFWLGVWWRPLLAAFACLTTLAVMTAVSRRKRELIGEPLVFSDFGLLRLVVRHPDLYYTGFMAQPPFLLAVAVFVGGVAAWVWLEPAAIGLGTSVLLLALVATLIAAAWTWAEGGTVAAHLRRRLPCPALEDHVARWGLLATLCLYALRWRGEIHEPFAVPRPFPGAAPLAPDLVVVVQLESFLDPGRLPFGPVDMPGLAAIRRRALFHGPLRVPSHGAFTMRSETAVLTGLSEAELGFRRFDPYLTARGTAPPSLARALDRQGFATLFLHPFRPGFFGRSGVIPRFGFARALFEDDFRDAAREGPYVSDAAMAARLLDEAGAMRTRRGLLVAVTMENHGPWSSDRLPDEPDPVRQYLRHVANADRAMVTLVDGLSGHPGRVLLCLYGDHPPILPGVPVATEPTTDYAVLLLGEGVPQEPGRQRPLRADELGRLVATLAGAFSGQHGATGTVHAPAAPA